LKERSASLEALIQGDRRSLSDLKEKRDAILADLEADETKLQELRTQLKDSSELLDQRTKELEEVKREHAKVAKSFDKLLKEISAKVSFLDVEAALFLSLQNDDIEKLGVSRSSIYRKCHLESIALPLLKGNLNIVLTEEVKLWHAFCTHCLHSISIEKLLTWMSMALIRSSNPGRYPTTESRSTLTSSMMKIVQ
jgi:structural maintenance of chromosome 1